MRILVDRGNTNSGADPGFEKGGFNVVPKSDTEAPLTIIYENTTRRELKIIIS